jgi:hypothetical protein
MAREESTTQKVKQALKAAGCPDVSVTRGQGTGYVVRQVKIRKGTYEYLFEHWSTPANPRGGYSGLREGGRRYVSPKQFGSVRELCGAFPLLADFLPKVFPAGGR